MTNPINPGRAEFLRVKAELDKLTLDCAVIIRPGQRVRGMFLGIRDGTHVAGFEWFRSGAHFMTGRVYGRILGKGATYAEALDKAKARLKKLEEMEKRRDGQD